MQCLLPAIVFVAACGFQAAATVEGPGGSSPDAPHAVDATTAVPLAGFGDLTGMCGVLGPAVAGTSPQLFRDTLTFARRYNDPADRPLLTPGGRHLAETPNAGGSSGLSEIFAYEELARCELAQLLKTETEIVYDHTGKITDFEVALAGHKIGVSVTRAMTFPFGQTYTLDAANALISRKLSDILLSSANVSAADHWDKQILAVVAWDDAAADTVMQAWSMMDAGTKANTLVVVTSTAGDDTFIYSNM